MQRIISKRAILHFKSKIITRKNYFRNFSSTNIPNNELSSVPALDYQSIETFENILDASVIASSYPDLGNHASHYIMNVIYQTHLFSGLPYWETIIAITVGIRILLLPLAIHLIKGTIKIQQMKPEMEKINLAYKHHPNWKDKEVTQKFKDEI